VGTTGSGARLLLLRIEGRDVTATGFGGRRAGAPRGRRRVPVPNAKPGGLRVEMTLEQACPPEYWRAQCAFKDSMVH
jgi:hypothetical protein